ncbi:MAG: hypothetical protein INF75_05295 [Roseomonas sp.]|nr:hypothetical protein [Roseomonas sp.]MCA3327998.1 hypothetical protein [Roseomonas sp.]MCA3332699.1 hypothetical protein [Roseomonas sp.]MCA3335016.1 hypothetical protein [Roseomonas sp.]MCA3346369.1 hypothetical protein [Roseomonas sp.]
MSGAALAEIREAEAPPDIAAIYAALNEGIGIGQVNLIWRHAAALPGVLDWLWAQAAPALLSGAAAAARDRIAASIKLPMPVTTQQPHHRAAITDLIDIYNRGNLTNLALLSAISLRAQGMAPGATPTVAARGAMLPRPPALPRLAALPVALQAQIRALTAAHGLSDAAVVPSLYLHLALWPEFLAGLPDMLAPLRADAGLTQSRDAAIEAARDAAPGLIAALGPAPAPPPALPEFLARLEVFVREVIPGMVPVGIFLRRVLT